MKHNSKSAVTAAWLLAFVLVYVSAWAQDIKRASEEKYLGDERMRLFYLEAFRKGVIDATEGNTLTIRSPNKVSRQPQSKKAVKDGADIEGYYDGMMAVLTLVDDLKPEWRAKREESFRQLRESLRGSQRAK